MTIFRWICTIRLVADYLRHPSRALRVAPVSGHDFEVSDDWNVLARIDVLVCQDCGETSLGWHRL